MTPQEFQFAARSFESFLADGAMVHARPSFGPLPKGHVDVATNRHHATASWFDENLDEDITLAIIKLDPERGVYQIDEVHEGG
jgi:hypothetical protein